MRQIMGNKTAGTAFEREFACRLAAEGFWVHLFQDNRNGQPCDIMAAREGETYLFDCKNCDRKYFRLSRMEANQLNAMELFCRAGNRGGMFAIRFPRGPVWLADYRVLRGLRDQGVKSLGISEIRTYARSLEDWLLEAGGQGREERNDAGYGWV